MRKIQPLSILLAGLGLAAIYYGFMLKSRPEIPQPLVLTPKEAKRLQQQTATGRSQQLTIPQNETPGVSYTQQRGSAI